MDRSIALKQKRVKKYWKKESKSESERENCMFGTVRDKKKNRKRRFFLSPF